MPVDVPVQRTRPPARRGGVRALAAGVSVAAAASLAVLIVTALSSSTGQLVDDAAMNAVTATNTAELAVLSGLGRVSLGSILAVAVVCVVIAALRRRIALAVGAVTIIAGANITTQALKILLDRPNLGLGVHNSLPSGHTTVVASAVAALMLVLPTVVRPLLAVVGSAAIGLTGLSTIVAGWHRPADVVAALLVVLLWTGGVRAVGGGRRGHLLASAWTAVVGAIGSVVFLVILGVRPAQTWHDVTLAAGVLSAVALLAAAAVALTAAMAPAHD